MISRCSFPVYRIKALKILRNRVFKSVAIGHLLSAVIGFLPENDSIQIIVDAQ